MANKKNEIFNNKKLLLTHVVYEIDMYIYTYNRTCYLLSLKNRENNWQNEYNLTWIAHRTSLRNLIDFFFWKSETWFKDEEKHKGQESNILYQYFSFAMKTKIKSRLKAINSGKLKSFINKSISHLTDERYKKGTEIDAYLANSIQSVYMTLKDIIIDFINDLLNNKNITYTNTFTNKLKHLDDEIDYYRDELIILLKII